MVDSEVKSTRAFWRKKFFGATDAEAADPRPFEEVLAERPGAVVQRVQLL